jgi:transcriptional regulator with XRE-family HTH domain
MDAISGRIRRLLSEFDWSENELDRRAGLARGQVSKLIDRGGERASTQVVAKIADGLGVTLDWLVRGKEPRDVRELARWYARVREANNWDEIKRRVMAARPELPEWAIEAAGDYPNRGALALLTADYVADLAVLAQKHGPRPDAARM